MNNIKWFYLTIIVFVIRIVENNGQQLDSLVSQKQYYSSLDDWSTKINAEIKTINHLTAFYAWELSTNPTEEISARSIDFNTLKSKWITLRCSEVDSFSAQINLIDNSYRRMFRLLCRGPRFSDIESVHLSRSLYQMQTIYTGTQICIPTHLDLCRNLDHIWDFTYVRRPNGNIEWFDMNAVRMKKDYKSNLTFFTGNISDIYYAFGEDITGDVTVEDVSVVENRIRSGPFLCFDSEPDLDRIMEGDFSSLRRGDCNIRTNEIFRWSWEGWRLAVGTQIGHIYPQVKNIMNEGARKNGYDDIGDVWREEVEVPNLRSKMEKLLLDIKPFYQLLHGVLRNVLWNRIHRYENFDKDKTMPAHMLGSMWSQSWELYHDLIIPFAEVNLDENIRKTKWTNHDMVKRVDDFYSSIGLPKMTKTFWEKSKFEKLDEQQNCHGTAANMFNESDYRMIVCAADSINDLYVIVHEMGHIQYFMAFAKQPPIFQDANSGLQESIGDAIYLGVMTPQHLNRLSLLPDKYLMSQELAQFDQSYLRAVHSLNTNDGAQEFMDFPNTENENNNKNLQKILEKRKSFSNALPFTILSKTYPNISQRVDRMYNYQKFKAKLDDSVNSFDLSLLLRMALLKIPQIPFEYILDVFRWDLFSGKVDMKNANEYFWKLIIQEQGLHPPDWLNRKNMFDAGAKFHVADNTPFVRYFLASFMHAQIFRGLCEVTVFGSVKGGSEPLPMPLHRCDIYGSKRAGKLIQKALKLGASKDWEDILFILTGSREISADALLQYYSPLIRWLEKLSNEFNISIGW